MKTGMPAYAEIQWRISGVAHCILCAHGVFQQLAADDKLKRKRILLSGAFVVAEPQQHFCGGLFAYVKHFIPGKTVLLHGVGFIAVAVLILQQPSYNGKQDGGKTIPVTLIPPPDDIPVPAVLQRLQFGAQRGNTSPDVFVLKKNHPAKLFIGVGTSFTRQRKSLGLSLGNLVTVWT